MARIEWVKQRLENWALWHDRQSRGGLGFAGRASFLAEVDSSRYRESQVPVDEIEASITGDAVAALGQSHRHLHITLQLIYLKGCGVKEAGRKMGKAESTVHAHLEQADGHLARWFTERKRVQEAQAVVFRATIEAARVARGFTP